MTKIENSGIQTGICGNLVYEQYMNKKSHLKLYTNLFCCCVTLPATQKNNVPRFSPVTVIVEESFVVIFNTRHDHF